MQSDTKINPFRSFDRPLVMAHRGDRTVSPENSIVSFKNAVLMEIDVIETDLRLTKDHELVLFHDSHLDQKTDAKGPLINYTLKELQNVDFGYSFTLDEGQTYPCRGKGYRIVTLREAFERFPVKFNLDIKNEEPEAPKILADLIEEYNKHETVMVGSFHHDQIVRFRRRMPDVLTAASPKEVKKFLMLLKTHLTRFWTPSYKAFQVPITYGNRRIITKQFVEIAHSKDVAVHVWVINDRITFDWLTELGIDGIFTDDPWLLFEVLNDRNLLK
jgi:glycerophosphoryl diester phosphodiesterase